MGLDITYYKNLIKIDCVFNSDGDPIDSETHEEIEDFFQPYLNPDFPGRLEGIEDKSVYEYDESEGFRAGSYGGYNQWREQLSELAGYPEKYCSYRKTNRYDAGAGYAGSGPFYELIYFSDCEGTIGPKVSAKLASDFVAFQGKADALDDKRFRDLYNEWRIAFGTAAQNGAVDFH